MNAVNQDVQGMIRKMKDITQAQPGKPISQIYEEVAVEYVGKIKDWTNKDMYTILVHS